MFDYLFYVYLKLQNKNTFILKCSKSLSLCNVSNYTYFKKIDKNSIKLGQSNICRFCNKGFESDFERDNKDVISLKEFISLKDTFLADSYIKNLQSKILKILKENFPF